MVSQGPSKTTLIMIMNCLCLPRAIQEEAANLMDQAHPKVGGPGRLPLAHLAAACTNIVVKLNSLPVLLEEICAAVSTRADTIASASRKIAAQLNLRVPLTNWIEFGRLQLNKMTGVQNQVIPLKTIDCCWRVHNSADNINCLAKMRPAWQRNVAG